MSARATAWAWSQIASGRGGSPVSKLVLLRLADRADPGGKCWPGHEKTASDLGISETSVKNAVRWLESADFIQIERQKIGGRDATNIYHLQIDGEGANSAPRGAKNADFEGANSAPESVSKENPKKESARGGRGVRYEIDPKTGIHNSPADPRDRAALAQISQHPETQIMAAVIAARAMDDSARAFPSAVLRHLLRATGSSARDDTPAWARAHAHATVPAAPSAGAGGQIIEGEMQWID